MFVEELLEQPCGAFPKPHLVEDLRLPEARQQPLVPCRFRSPGEGSFLLKGRFCRPERRERLLTPVHLLQAQAAQVGYQTPERREAKFLNQTLGLIELPARQADVFQGDVELDKPKQHLRHRSEEHTSELQSHSDLVCRLLLEKKNKPGKPEPN